MPCATTLTNGRTTPASGICCSAWLRCGCHLALLHLGHLDGHWLTSPHWRLGLHGAGWTATGQRVGSSRCVDKLPWACALGLVISILLDGESQPQSPPLSLGLLLVPCAGDRAKLQLPCVYCPCPIHVHIAPGLSCPVLSGLDCARPALWSLLLTVAFCVHWFHARPHWRTAEQHLPPALLGRAVHAAGASGGCA